MSDRQLIVVKADLEFMVELDGTRSLQDVIEDFELEINQPKGSTVEMTQNNFTVMSSDDDYDDIF